MSTGEKKSEAKLIGVLIIIAGALVVVAAGVTLGMASSQLKAGQMTVSAVTPAATANASGKPVADPNHAEPPAGMNQGNSKDVMALPDSRDSMTNGSFLRALFVIAAAALAIAAPVMGIGVLFALVDFGPLKGSRRRKISDSSC